MNSFLVLSSTLRRVWRYLANLQWAEKPQPVCVFCQHKNLRIVFEDDKILAFNNRHNNGLHHWLIIPKAHALRDIEALTCDHTDLLQAMDTAKRRLLKQYCPDQPASAVHSGYHRGRRPLWGTMFYPDIVSIHHLHLHVIVRPCLTSYLFKHPFWLPLMWKSDTRVLREAGLKERKGI